MPLAPRSFVPGYRLVPPPLVRYDRAVIGARTAYASQPAEANCGVPARHAARSSTFFGTAPRAPGLATIALARKNE